MAGETMIKSYNQNNNGNTSPGSVHCKQPNNNNRERVTTYGPIIKSTTTKSNPFLRCIEQNRQIAANMNMQKEILSNEHDSFQPNRISRLRKPNRAEDYYYSDDESKNKIEPELVEIIHMLF